MKGGAGAIRWLRGPGAALLLALAVMVGLGLRWSAQHPLSRYSSDSYQYILLARGLAQGDGFASGGSEHPDLTRSPLLPAAAAALAPLAGGAEPAVRLLAALAGALMVIPLFLLARSGLGPGPALAMLPLAALSCLLGASVHLLPTALFTALLLAALTAAEDAARRGRLPAVLLAGLLAGLAALTRAEGLAWAPLLAAWVVLACPKSRPVRRRLAAAALLLATTAAVYAPYLAWVSSRLDRLDPAPGITYLARMREISDRYGMRWIDGGEVPWQDRAMGLLSADHSRLVLKEWFETSVEPEPDAKAIRPPYSGPATEVSEEPTAGAILSRRLSITAGNAFQLQRAVRYGHFAPAVLLLLVLAGLPALLSRRHRRIAALLLAGLVVSLAPILSHVENRFLYTAFALSLLPAAAGWRALDRQAGRLGGRAARAACSLLLLALVTGAGWAHAASMRRPAAVAMAMEQAAAAAGAGPPGAVLGVQPAVAYRAGRPFRLLPVAPVPAVREYAAAQGASILVVEGDRDLSLRPDLVPLLSGPLPDGMRWLLDQPDPRGGRLLVLALDGEPGS